MDVCLRLWRLVRAISIFITRRSPKNSLWWQKSLVPFSIWVNLLLFFPFVQCADSSPLEEGRFKLLLSILRNNCPLAFSETDRQIPPVPGDLDSFMDRQTSSSGDRIENQVGSTPVSGQTMLFVNTAQMARDLAVRLSDLGVRCLPFHSLLPAEDRRTNLARFQAGASEVLCWSARTARPADWTSPPWTTSYRCRQIDRRPTIQFCSVEYTISFALAYS